MSNTITVNFEGVEAGSNFAHIPEGDYAFKITKVVKKVGQDSGAEYLLFSLKVTKGNPKGMGKTIPHNCSLKKNALWNLRNLLEASGKAVPAKAIKIDLDKLVGLELAGTVVDDEYEGKKKSVVSAFFPAIELVDDSKPQDKTTEDEVVEGSEESDSAGDTEEEEELFG